MNNRYNKLVQETFRLKVSLYSPKTLTESSHTITKNHNKIEKNIHGYTTEY